MPGERVRRSRPLSRRGLLLGSTGVGLGAVTAVGVGVERGVLPGRPRVQHLLGLNGADGTIPDVTPGPLVEGSFVSRARGGRATGWTLAMPPPGLPERPQGPREAPLPVLVELHGMGGDHRASFGGALGLEYFLAAEVARHGRRFAIASVDGGDSYWHPRPDGEDAGAMVLDELLPMLAEHGVDVSAVAFGGWSMGGYGALRLASVLGSERCRAVAAISPGLWLDASDASRTGFVDADEYREFTVLGRQRELDGIAVRVDCGTGDPFYRAARHYVAGFPRNAGVVSDFEPGGHDLGYWRRMAPARLAFVARHLVTT